MRARQTTVGALHRKLLIVCLAATFAAAGCKPRRFNQQELGSQMQIAGGSLVSTGDLEAKSTVALIMERIGNGQREYAPFCSGTLISPTVVLTAAHCVIGVSASVIFASFAVDARNTTPEVASSRAIGAIIGHPDYVPGDGIPYGPSYRGSDLALLKLKKAAPAGAIPVSLIADDIAGSEGTAVTLAGYGFTQDDGEINSGDLGILRKVNVTILDSREWQSDSGVLVYAGPGGKGACSGDSGGPMYLRKGNALVLVGATKGGGECGNPTVDNNGMYTSLFVYRKWIACSSGVDVDRGTDVSAWQPFGCMPKSQICSEMVVRAGASAHLYMPGRYGLRWRDMDVLQAGTIVNVESWMGSWIRFDSTQGFGFAEHRSFSPAGSCMPVVEGGIVKVNTSTVLKQQPVDSSILHNEQKCSLSAGTELDVAGVRRSEFLPNHVIVTLKAALPGCAIGPMAFLYELHVEIPDLLIP